MKTIKQEKIKISNGEIPITLSIDEEVFVIDIDGIEWLETENQIHASVLFTMMKEHITEYMNYKKI